MSDDTTLVSAERLRIAVDPESMSSLQVLDGFNVRLPDQLWVALMSAEETKDQCMYDDDSDSLVLCSDSSENLDLTDEPCGESAFATEDPLRFASWPSSLRDRLHPINLPSQDDLSLRGEVIYWMRSCPRVHSNAALDAAERIAVDLRLPLRVVVALSEEEFEDMRSLSPPSVSLHRQTALFLSAALSFRERLSRVKGLGCDLVVAASEWEAVSARCQSAAVLVSDDSFFPGDSVKVFAPIVAAAPCLPVLLLGSAVTDPRRQWPSEPSLQEYTAWFRRELCAAARPATAGCAQGAMESPESCSMWSCVANACDAYFRSSPVAAWSEESALALAASRDCAPEELLMSVRAGVLAAAALIANQSPLLDDCALDEFALHLCVRRESHILEPGGRLNWRALVEDGAGAGPPPLRCVDFSVLFPANVCTASTGDPCFDALQQELVACGRLSHDALALWLRWLLEKMPSSEIGLQHALTSLACHWILRPHKNPAIFAHLVIFASKHQSSLK